MQGNAFKNFAFITTAISQWQWQYRLQGGQWGFIKYRPPKKKQISTKLFEISTTQHYIDQISTAKVP